VTVVEAQAHLSELLDKVEAGEQVVITRRGKPVASMSAVAQPKKPIPSMAALRARIPKLKEPLSETLRKLRDEQY
jgi:antitoxin (DNA-binding transcriptional repressor) of toxin-antitoxin stability system